MGRRKKDAAGPRGKGKGKGKAAGTRGPSGSGLTLKQARFVDAYLGQANGNSLEAARLAGYRAPHPEGARLLRNATIRAAVDARLAESAMSAREVLARLSEMARASIDDVVELDDAGEPHADLRKARASGKLRLVRKITPTKHGLTIEVYDAQAALAQLGKYHGLWLERPATPDAHGAPPRLAIPSHDERFESESDAGRPPAEG
jgi:hypothetical protein